MSAEIIKLDAFRAKAIDVEDEPCDLATAIDVAIRDLGEIIEYWGSEAARARTIECERMLRRVFKNGVVPSAS